MGTVTVTAEANASVICTAKASRNGVNWSISPDRGQPVDSLCASCWESVDKRRLLVGDESELWARRCTGSRDRRTPVDNLCATGCVDVDTAVSLGDSGADDTPGAVDNRLRRSQPTDRVLLSRRTWRSSSARQSKRLIIAVSPVQVRSPLPEPCVEGFTLHVR
jgi:hypothetical protein